MFNFEKYCLPICSPRAWTFACEVSYQNTFAPDSDWQDTILSISELGNICVVTCGREDGTIYQDSIDLEEWYGSELTPSEVASTYAYQVQHDHTRHGLECIVRCELLSSNESELSLEVSITSDSVMSRGVITESVSQVTIKLPIFSQDYISTME